MRYQEAQLNEQIIAAAAQNSEFTPEDSPSKAAIESLSTPSKTPEDAFVGILVTNDQSLNEQLG